MRCEYTPHASIPVVIVGHCQAERDAVAGVIAEQVQLEAVAPSHCALAVLGNASKHLVKMSPDIVVNTGEITNFFRLSYHELACF